ncbi:casein kinase 2 regulatory subunit [Datura stramonium]|uniref:Casein kinase II subunit beta n=1 Tax=Datura stramonium TaxID=4076 RepID=A0ABS8WWR4_DATST|nr:casein kinase 2 regulatory subunit [Datura stramonium]
MRLYGGECGIDDDGNGLEKVSLGLGLGERGERRSPLLESCWYVTLQSHRVVSAYGSCYYLYFIFHLMQTSIDIFYLCDMFTEEQNELVESAAEMLYGLIHVRYILTSKGMAAMLEKYKNYDFGRCPRVYCSGQPCLPVGQSDIPRSSTVKIYCPKCDDIYYPRSKYQGNIDGAYFGTTFPHLFLMTYGHLKPQKPTQNYVPRVFGFKIHRT